LLAIDADHLRRQNRLDAKQQRNLVRRWIGDQTQCISARHDATGLHHGNPVRERKRLVTVMCDQHRRRPCLMEALPQRR
jgi:hypothetical protein